MEQEEEVTIKVEDEMGIFVKEEESIIGVASTSAYDDDASINVADLLVEPRQPFVGLEDFQKQPLVYTTKLDEMHLWKYLSKFKYPYNIINKIIIESKPNFPSILKKRRKRKSLVKFNKLVANLSIYNQIAEDYSQLQNETLTTKGEIIKEKQRQIHSEIINIDDEYDEYDDASPVISTHSDDSMITADDEETDIISTVAVDTNMCSDSVNAAGNEPSTDRLKSTRYILIINTFRSPNDVYFVDNSGIPTGYFRLQENNLSINYDDTIFKVSVNNCCWFKRDMKLKHFDLENGSLLLNKFIRTPHGCDIGNCTCCCKRTYFVASKFTKPKSIHRTIKSDGNSQWHSRLISRGVQKNQNSLINSALVHKPKIKTLNTKVNKRDYYSDLCVILNGDQNLTHAYYIGKNGLINVHLRSNTICSLQYFKNMIGLWSSALPSENICCLTEYKKNCLKLIKLAHPTVVKFLINNLKTKSDKCESCANQEIQKDACAKGVVVPLYLPKYPRHTKPYSKYIIRAFNVAGRGKNVHPSTNSNTQTEKTIDKSMNSSLDKSNNSSLHLHGNKNNKTVSASSINLGVGDLRLVILPGGKVKVVSEISPDEISTYKLKILKEIIQHAQNKITSEGFNPTQQISVKNLFAKNPSTQNIQKIHKKQEAPTNILQTALKRSQVVTSSEKVTNQLSVPKKIQNISEPVTTSKVPGQLHTTISESNWTKIDRNFYQVLRDISAEKRKQYLISHEFLRHANSNLWADVSGYEKVCDEVTSNIVNNKIKNIKRKTFQADASPPPKQFRTGNLENTISAVPMDSTNPISLPIVPPTVSVQSTLLLPTTQQSQMTVLLSSLPKTHAITSSLPTLAPKVSAKTLRQPQTTILLPNSTLSNAHQQHIVPIAPSLQQIQAPQAALHNTTGVTVIPIGQLPKELVTSLYAKYAFLPQNSQSLNVHVPPLNPINVTDQLLPTGSLVHNSNTTSFVPELNDVIPNTPVVENAPIENIELDDADAEDEDCILGV